MQLGLGFMAPKVLLSAVELGLFTELARGAKDAKSLRKALGLHPRSTLDFLDTLVALGLLERRNGRYRNSPDADLFLDKNKPGYIGGILEMANARLYPFWGNLTKGLRTGLPQNEARNGGNAFEELYADPQRLKGFLQAMTGLSLGIGKAIANQFPWKKYKSFADIGTAQGGLPAMVCLQHKHLSAVGFDLPEMRPHFESYVKSFGFDGRLRFEAGNFFSDPLPSADVLVMGHILHDWNMDEKRMLLGKAFRALPKGGALIVFEALMDDARSKNVFGLLMSLNMLIETPGGFDYTGRDCSKWMREAGFRKTYVEHLVGPDSMVIAIK
jgi:hypothetical protein